MTKDYGRGRGAKNRIAKAERKAAWNQAISEGRVVKFPQTGAFTCYPSIDQRNIALAVAKANGLITEVVPAAGPRAQEALNG